MPADLIPGELAAAGAEVRLAGPADAAGRQPVAGPASGEPAGAAAPRFVAAPASTAEASAVLAAAARLGLAVTFRGSGTRLHWGPPPARCDLIVDTGRMDQVLEHAAGDLVARVQAGVPLDRLAAVLATAGQRLALDPPSSSPPSSGPPSSGTAGGSGGSSPRASTAEGSGRSSPRAGTAGVSGAGTVGGMLATGVAGPLRLRFGTPRDLVIGITVVRADGTVARSGGKVVKNVAGYDLGKLFAGSYGTLGLIAEATFRLHPLPPAAAFVTLDCVDPQAAQDVMVAAAAAPVVPSAAEIHWPAATAPVSAAVLVEGDPDGVAEGAARLAGLLAEAASEGAADRPPRAADSPEPVLQPTAPAWWGRDALGGDGTMLRIAFWPGDLAAVLTATRAAAAEAGLDGAGPAVTVTGSAAAGVLHAEVPAAAPGAAAGRFVTALRDRLAAIGGDRPGPSVRASAIVLHAPAGSSDGLDFWGPVPSLPLMRAVKDQFDPEHRLAPGRFAGGI